MDTLQTQLEGINYSDGIKVTTKYTSGKLVVPKEIHPEKVNGELWINYRFPTGGKVKNPRGALAQFLSLADEKTTGDHLIKFVQEWGVLCICGHNRIASHDNRCFPRIDEPFYSQAQSSLAVDNDLKDKIALKMQLEQLGLWFQEPLSVWLQYARRMKSLINIFRNLRGDEHSNTLDDWSILRQIEIPEEYSEVHSLVRQYENGLGVPAHQMSVDQKCRVLGSILTTWMGEGLLVPRLEWATLGSRSSSPTLAAQLTLNATYSDVNLFFSDHLTLFGVLVSQCIQTLGPDQFLRRCNCTGCEAHNGDCQELIQLSIDRGRPSTYCSSCKPYIRKQQKRISRKRTKKGVNNYE